MAKIYARWIKDGKMTLEQVPLRWSAAVGALLQTACGVTACF